MNVKLEIFRYRVVACEIGRRVVNSPKNDDVFFFSVVKTRNRHEDTSQTEWYEQYLSFNHDKEKRANKRME